MICPFFIITQVFTATLLMILQLYQMTTLTAAEASLLKGLHTVTKTGLASDNILRFNNIFFTYRH